MTAMLAARNVLGENFDCWKVNTEAEYHEEDNAKPGALKFFKVIFRATPGSEPQEEVVKAANENEARDQVQAVHGVSHPPDCQHHGSHRLIVHRHARPPTASLPAQPRDAEEPSAESAQAPARQTHGPGRVDGALLDRGRADRGHRDAGMGLFRDAGDQGVVRAARQYPGPGAGVPR